MTGFVFRALLMTIGMFSVFPSNKNSWHNECANLVIPFLPVVGALIGAVWYVASFIIINSGIPVFIQSSFVLLIPFILSGFLHTDGFMDTADAVFSRRGLEEKRRILKDPNAGAFAVISLVCLFVLQYSAVYTIMETPYKLVVFAFIPVISRGVAGAVLLNTKLISENGYAAVFKAGTTYLHTAAVLAVMVLAMLTAYLLVGRFAVISLLAVIISALLAALYVYRQLDGFSGDLCGCVITAGELFGLLCLAIL